MIIHLFGLGITFIPVPSFPAIPTPQTYLPDPAASMILPKRPCHSFTSRMKSYLLSMAFKALHNLAQPDLSATSGLPSHLPFSLSPCHSSDISLLLLCPLPGSTLFLYLESLPFSLPGRIQLCLWSPVYPGRLCSVQRERLQLEWTLFKSHLCHELVM